jgi:hypothetical protein
MTDQPTAAVKCSLCLLPMFVPIGESQDGTGSPFPQIARETRGTAAQTIPQTLRDGTGKLASQDACQTAILWVRSLQSRTPSLTPTARPKRPTLPGEAMPPLPPFPSNLYPLNHRG